MSFVALDAGFFWRKIVTLIVAVFSSNSSRSVGMAHVLLLFAYLFDCSEGMYAESLYSKCVFYSIGG